ncbi:MAG: cupredoxin domain-containing protein [Patescibacteria group bacterium]
MPKRLISLSIMTAGLVLFGAACSSKTTISSGNKNTTFTTTVNTALTPTNSRTTGDFTTRPAQTSTVTLNSSGADPLIVTVSAGTTVTFVNNDSGLHQISSNPHPAHTGLPGFDSLSGIKPGQSYSFTFATAGTFDYHDHLDPANSAWAGKIIVQ